MLEPKSSEVSVDDDEFLKSLEQYDQMKTLLKNLNQADISDSEFLSELDDNPISDAQIMGYNKFSYETKAIHLLYLLLGILALAFLYKFVFSGGGEKLFKNKLLAIPESQTEASLFPQYEGGDIEFPCFSFRQI